jgi:hypothetical protein
MAPVFAFALGLALGSGLVGDAATPRAEPCVGYLVAGAGTAAVDGCYKPALKPVCEVASSSTRGTSSTNGRAPGVSASAARHTPRCFTPQPQGPRCLQRRREPRSEIPAAAAALGKRMTELGIAQQSIARVCRRRRRRRLPHPSRSHLRRRRHLRRCGWYFQTSSTARR